MERVLLSAVALLGIFATAETARAQDTISPALELRGGFTHPVPCLIECGGYPSKGTAGLWEIGLELRLHPNMSFFGTYSSYGLREDEDREPERGWGYGLGVRIRFAPRSWIGPWIRASLIRHRRTNRFLGAPVETAEVTTDWGWGKEFGAGLSVRIIPGLSVSPGIRYQNYSAKADWGRAFQEPRPPIPIETSHFIFDLGLRLGK